MQPRILARLKDSRFLLTLSKVQWSQIAFPLLVILPLMGFYIIIPPDRFLKMWGGYFTIVYTAFFVVLTWLHNFLVSKEQSAKTHVVWLGVIVFIAGISVYQFLLYNTDLPILINQAGASLGFMPHPWSWNWRISIDLIIFMAYMIGLIIFFFSLKSLKYFLGPILYSAILVLALLVDAAYPLFTVFQWWVPGIVFLVANLLRIFGVNVTYSKDVLYTPKSGPILIGWPCAGIHSLLIYTAVAYSFLQNLEISRVRKLIYLSMGFLGTYMVNILRIAAIVFANYYFNVDIMIFHYYAGELFFIAWILVFLFAVVMVERRRKRKMENNIQLVSGPDLGSP